MKKYGINVEGEVHFLYIKEEQNLVFFDFSLTVKAAPHECVIRTGQP